MQGSLLLRTNMTYQALNFKNTLLLLILLKLLKMIFNKSLEDGILPNSWKEANVIPIYKAGNYRPLSITSIYCRMMEKLRRNAIVKHLISKVQYGFCSAYSCTTQLIESLEDWSISINERLQC